MQSVELTLVSYEYAYDEIGQEIKTVKERLIPIIETTSVLLEEKYAANNQKLNPEIRFVISSLNYSGETELIYMNQVYSVIRTSSPYVDEISLICEKKIGNVSYKKS